MKTIWRLIAAAVLAVGFSGCATPIKRVALNTQVHGSPKTVKVLPMRYSEVDLFIVGNPGYNFGLIGVAIAEGNRVPKANWLRDQVRERKLDHVATFRRALQDAMNERGHAFEFSETVMEGERAKTKRSQWGLRKQYDAAGAPVEAQLDVNFGFVGYTAAGAGDSSPYRPTVVVSARLVSADGKRVLFEDQIVYNSAFTLRQTDAITINPDERYRYPDFDDMKAAGPAVVDGLELALQAAAAELAKQL